MQSPKKTLNKLPDSLSSPRAKLVYYHIVNEGKATLESICDTLNLKKITTYPILSTLVEKGLLQKSKNHYTIPT